MVPITSAKTPGKVHRRYRKDLKLSQSKAGNKFNPPQKTVSNIESGLSGVQLGPVFRYMAALKLEMHLTPRVTEFEDDKLW